VNGDPVGRVCRISVHKDMAYAAGGPPAGVEDAQLIPRQMF